jgi:type VI secretion system protein ImpA
MTIATTLDIAALLAPITEAEPNGEDLSFSASFDEITAARREDDPTLDQGEWVTTLKEADWPLVIELTSQLLITQTKDIRLAVWMTEALCKNRGLAGLADGLALIDQLCERYWDTLYPLPDGEDQEQRIGNLSWLIQRASTLVKQMPLTGGAVAYSYNDSLTAQSLQQAIDRDPDNAAALAEGKTTTQTMHTAATDSGRKFYEDLLHDLQLAKSAFAAFTRRIDGLLGNDGPSFRLLQDALEEVGILIARFARQLGIGNETAGGEAAEGEASGITEVGAAGVTGPIRSRAQALQQLRIVADFFRRTEPHSPVAYLADKAAPWGDMPLHAWLRAVIKNADALSHLEEMLGVERQRDVDD